jgi:hypothetical protein
MQRNVVRSHLNLSEKKACGGWEGEGALGGKEIIATDTQRIFFDLKLFIFTFTSLSLQVFYQKVKSNKQAFEVWFGSDLVEGTM